MRNARLTIITLTLVLLYTILGVAGIAQGVEPVPELISVDGFTDVVDSHANFDAVTYVHEMNIVKGYEDGTFKPDQTINRAEFTKILVASAYDYSPETDPSDIDIYSSGEFAFTDIEDQAWYIPYLRVAVNNMVIEGYSDGTFMPDNDVNFAEAAKIIVTSFEFETTTDPDVWFKGYVDVLAGKNAIPKSIEAFDQSVTRGEMAEMIYRAVGLVTDKESMTYGEITALVAIEQAIEETVAEINETLPGETETGVATKEEIAGTVLGDSLPVSLYFGYPSENVAAESYPMYAMDCFELDCPTFPLYSGEWTLNTKDRLAFDTERNVIYYPRMENTFQIVKFDPVTEKSFLTGFEERHDMSYRPYIWGDTMAVAVMDSGKETIVNYNLVTEEELSISAFDEYDACTWPAVSVDEVVFAVCNNLQTDYFVVDDTGEVYFSGKTHLESLVLDSTGIAYFVEDGFVIVLDLASKLFRGTDVIPPYHIVYTMTISQDGRYLAGMGEVSGEWVIGIYDRGTLIFTMPVQLDSVPGVPVFGPFMESDTRITEKILEPAPPVEEPPAETPPEEPVV